MIKNCDLKVWLKIIKILKEYIEQFLTDYFLKTVLFVKLIN